MAEGGGGGTLAVIGNILGFFTGSSRQGGQDLFDKVSFCDDPSEVMFDNLICFRFIMWQKLMRTSWMKLETWWAFITTFLNP